MIGSDRIGSNGVDVAGQSRMGVDVRMWPDGNVLLVVEVSELDSGRFESTRVGLSRIEFGRIELLGLCPVETGGVDLSGVELRGAELT